jgi:hypothetical protein
LNLTKYDLIGPFKKITFDFVTDYTIEDQDARGLG